MDSIGAQLTEILASTPEIKVINNVQSEQEHPEPWLDAIWHRVDILKDSPFIKYNGNTHSEQLHSIA